MQAAPTTYAPTVPGSTVPEAIKAKMKEKSQEFESFYIYQFLELVQPKTDNKVMNGGKGEEMFRHNLNEQLAKGITQSGGFGLSNMVYSALLQRQEATTQQPQTESSSYGK